MCFGTLEKESTWLKFDRACAVHKFEASPLPSLLPSCWPRRNFCPITLQSTWSLHLIHVLLQLQMPQNRLSSKYRFFLLVLLGAGRVTRGMQGSTFADQIAAKSTSHNSRQASQSVLVSITLKKSWIASCRLIRRTLFCCFICFYIVVHTTQH